MPMMFLWSLKFQAFLLPNPLRGMWAWQKTKDPRTPATPGPGLKVAVTKEVAKKLAAQRVHRRTLQNG